MSKVLDFSGDDGFCGGFLYGNPNKSGLFLSLSSQVDVYFPPRKRSRISAPFVVSEERKQQPTIEVLPDECLFEVFRRLSGDQERSACACVSKRWLLLLSTIHRDEICTAAAAQSVEPEIKSEAETNSAMPKEKGEFVDLNGIRSEDEESVGTDPHGYLSRCLEGKKATDIRLAAISVGTASRGGLGKLSIRGNKFTKNLSNLGLKAISRGCPSLGALSLWNVSSIGDEGLFDIASGCHLLEKLELLQCSAISDKGLAAIARNCPNLTTVTIEYCPKIGDESLLALGRNCPNLKCVTVKKCPLVGDRGVANLFSSAGNVIEKANLHSLNISDVSLAVIGQYGTAMTRMALGNLINVNDRGFWVMGKGQGLQKLKVLSVTSCRGIGNSGLESIAVGCPDLKVVTLQDCPLVSDMGVTSFSKAACSLESLQLDECHGITQCGVFSVLTNCGGQLKSISLGNCLGIRDVNIRFPDTAPCYSLRSVTVRGCPGFGNAGLAMLGKLCQNLTHLNLIGLEGVTVSGILPLLRKSDSGLKKVNLSGCVNVTDNVVGEIAELHGETLEVLNLDGCRLVTDLSLMAIARNCPILSELDVSKSLVTDSGIAVLAGAEQLNLQILSLSGCASLSDKSFPSLAILGNTLAGLNIQSCCGFSSGAIHLLFEHLWRCDTLH
ncbi:EIN3-binding F-box protein 1-like [Andrographis paniculata]|uniref:EIN3-binding F-box protein 1-like n=1 Tax=Andrographis paniculata TaxID=175694 RepID=UPI0021E8DE1E|nr:EIN3-binding F-box protein 1-like [Andrographis paniculata]